MLIFFMFLAEYLGELKYFHNTEKMELIVGDEIAKKFMCEVCHYGCRKESDFKKHLGSLKHKNGNKTTIKEFSKIAKDIKCARCSKEYKTNSGLWKHNKVCTYEPPKKHKLYEKNDIVDVLLKENLDFKNIILEVVKKNTELQTQNQEFQKQNQEFQKQMLEVCKKGNNTIISNNNNNNKTFNLQFFLNEQCKDAMNLTEFVDSMQLEFSDLEDVGKLGYVEGISKIMIRKLNELDVYKRPIHCSDAKREIMYVKEDNVWEKETNTNDHIRKAIKRVTHKNSGMLVPWSLENPNCMKYDHHLNDVYIRMMGQSMGGSGEFVDNENKIMKKIAKAVLIDKTC